MKIIDNIFSQYLDELKVLQYFGHNLAASNAFDSVMNL